MKCKIYRVRDKEWFYEEQKNFSTLKEFCEFVDKTFAADQNNAGGFLILPPEQGIYNFVISDDEQQ